MTFQEFGNKSIRPLYLITAILMVAVMIRLLMPFSPRIDISPDGQPALRAPFLSIPNIGPIAREVWLEDTLRECLSFLSTKMNEVVERCALLYFDINSQNAFLKVVPRTSFGRVMSSNLSVISEVQAVNTRGPYMIYEGSRSGRPLWRYQTEIMTTLFSGSQRSTRKWLIDLTMTFDTPDSLYFSGFRITNFFMRERT